MATEGEVKQAGRRAAGHPWFHHLSRVGLVARGLLYLLIGWLALRIGFGAGGGKEAERKGALQMVADGPGGMVVLWLMAAGFAALAAWQLAEVLYGRPVPDGHRFHERLGSAARSAVYAGGAAVTLGFLFGYQGTSSDKQSQTFTARAMGEPGGRWLVLAVAAGFLVWGGVVIVNAVRRGFLEELDTGRMSRAARRFVQPFGIAGNTARGLIGAGVGVFLGYAAITFQPDKAKGLDGTLREFAGSPAGTWGLLAVAAGLLVFGLYSFCEARWRKVDASGPSW
ncbi:DUF1206 domain-containing protein [Actinomadura livida]|uniref:DUF1206 domain-containing protein n=1 Tax=Actinomadura livida TaxID=79909 RepID=A0A7W7IH42_9ACTN|nr:MULTISPECIES: DUF1206 domain-containing protein [Actinomadura]MBB4776994.1 hypothetical protein [Actinomadura catellatispora]GGT96259.1 membrane protein [Actinomadura livida]